MADQPSNEALEVHLTYLRERMDEVVAHLRTQNGTLVAHGQAITRLQERTRDARSVSAKWSVGISAVVTGIVTALYHLFGGK